MRGLRSFLGLVAILIALGAYLYFVESQRTPGNDAEEKPKVFSVEADQIDALAIRTASGERTELKKSGAGWQIVSPVSAPADAGEVSSVASSLSNLEEERLIEENAGDLADFGLAEPRVEVTFSAGGEERRLLIGSKTPTGGDLYAKTGAAPRVFLIPSYLESSFNRGTFDLRDKAALKFDRSAADVVEITADGRTTRLVKSGGEWQIAEPAMSRPDSAAIEGLVARLANLQMKEVVEPDTAAPAKFGFEKPAATVRVGSGSSQATLLIGRTAGEGSVYAKDASRPEVFTIDATLLEDAKKPAAEYRQKDVFDARAFNTTRVEVSRGDRTTVLEKVDGTWRQTAPEAKDVEGSKVDTLLSALTSARADSFVERAPGEATTEATVAVTFDEGKQERVTFVRAGSDAYAARSDAPGAAKIEASVLDRIVKAIDETR